MKIFNSVLLLILFLLLAVEIPATNISQDLLDAVGTIYAQATYNLSTATSSGKFGITVPLTTPSGSNYLWSAYIYPSTATNPYNERYGLDDTFNYNTSGYPVGPETTIRVY